MKKHSEPTLSYEEAWTELQAIVEALQSEQISIDLLGEKVERAAELARYCRERLRQTEETLENLNRE